MKRAGKAAPEQHLSPEDAALDALTAWYRRFGSEMPGYGSAARTEALIGRGVLTPGEARRGGFSLSSRRFGEAMKEPLTGEALRRHEALVAHFREMVAAREAAAQARTPAPEASPPAPPVPPAAPPVPAADARDDWAERAAIMEYDGGLHPKDAAAAAAADVAQRLGADPGELHREASTADDERAYLEHLRIHGPATYGAVAAALGWGASRAGTTQDRLLTAGAAVLDAAGRASCR